MFRFFEFTLRRIRIGIEREVSRTTTTNTTKATITTTTKPIIRTTTEDTITLSVYKIHRIIKVKQNSNDKPGGLL